jgi:cell division protein FtsL
MIKKYSKTNKINLLLLLLILVLPIVIAEVKCSEIFVVNFNYDNGVITPLDKLTKCGFAPDRKLQPADGYKAEVLSVDNKMLHSFKFKIPLDVNFDLSTPIAKTISGGIVILNTTDFALIFPYYDDAKSIIIYDSQDKNVATIPLIEEQFIQKKSVWWVLLLVVLVLIAVYLIYTHFRKPKQPVQQYSSYSR